MIGRFMKHVKITDTCWIWTGSSYVYQGGQRYGCFWMNNKTTRAHRASWILHYGDIPAGMFICHKCDNSICVNPNHLFIGTHSDNMRDAVVKGRAFIGELGYQTILTNKSVLSIRKEYHNGATQICLANKYGVAESTIGRTVRGQNWNHVGGPLTLRGRGYRTDIYARGVR
jgi:hypothetical protein